MEPFTEGEIRDLAGTWYRMLDAHAPFDTVVELVAGNDFQIQIPEGSYRGVDGFKTVYEQGWIRHFFDELHELKQLSFAPDGDKAEVKVVVHWQARSWNPPEAKSTWIDMDAYQTWVVQRSLGSGRPVILTYIVDVLKPGSRSDSRPAMKITA